MNNVDPWALLCAALLAIMLAHLIRSRRAGWEGRLVKFKFFPIGSKEAPRFPIFLGERHSDDA